MSAIYRVTRRNFLRQLGVGTGAVVFGCAFPSEVFGAPKKRSIVQQLIHGFPVEGVPFVEFKLDGDVVIITHRAEMGQGIRSSLAAVLADEMEADWNRVTLRQADADSHSFGVEFPYQVAGRPKQYIVEGEVAQFTDSSRSMAAYFEPMRLFGAGIRLVMQRAAAARWGVKPEECVMRQHRVYHGDESIDIRWLLLAAKKTSLPTYEEIVDTGLKKPAEWRFIGKDSMPFTDATDMVTGKTKYAADLDMPGMLTAMIVRCPVANGRVKSFDDTETRKIGGVVSVEAIDIPGPLGAGGVGAAFMPHAGVAVVAKNTWAAWQGRRALKVEWDLSSEPAATNAKYESESYRKQLEASATGADVEVLQVRNRGNVDFGGAAKTVEASYYVPLIAQAPMEPPVAIARLDGKKLEVWTCTQNPDIAQQVAGLVAFNIPMERWDLESTKEDMRERVTLHMSLLGGGFGRKSKPDYIIEAAYLAAKHPGTPVRVQWTREDDIRFSYFNAASVQYLKAGLDPGGKATNILQRSVFPSIFATFFPPERADFSAEQNAFFARKREGYFDGGKYPYSSGIERAQGLEDLPFDIPNLRIENGPAHNYIRIGWARSVANVYHAFAIGSFAAEMAMAAGRDQKDYLLELIGKGSILQLSKEGVKHFGNNEFPVDQIDVPVPGGKSRTVVPGYPPDTRRLRRVVEVVAEKSGWDAKKGKLGPRRGLGIAAHRSFLSYIAVVFDVSLGPDNELTINEVHAAIDCGRAINPDRVRAQIEGGINYGLSMALLGEITVKNGAVVESNFDDYPALRIHQTPKERFIHILESSEPPTGVGEPPTPVVAPALANAIAAAGGPRIREMPFYKHVVVR